jgi:nitrogen regulatory protein P-II 1
MQKIEAIIQPKKWEDVRAALAQVGYPGVTLSEVKGHGKQMGIKQGFLGREVRIGMIPKIKLEIFASDGETQRIVDAIRESARTGKTGDGKIFVHPIEEAYRISSGESGEESVSV